MAEVKSKATKAEKPKDDASAAAVVDPVTVSSASTAADSVAPSVAATELAVADTPVAATASDTALAATTLLAHIGLDDEWSVYGQTCQAAVDVLKERCRQVGGEGYSIEQDDT